MEEKKKKSKQWGSGRVSFIACIDSIKEDVLKGLPIKHLHQKYSKKIDVSYSQFTRLVNTYIINKGKSEKKPTEDMEEIVKEVVKESKPEEKKEDVYTPSIKQFNYDNSIKDDDLI